MQVNDNNNNKQPPRHVTSTSALMSAISTLEQFTKKKETEQDLSVTDLAIQEGRLVTVETSSFQKIVHFFAAIFSKRARQEYIKQKQQIQHVVLQAIDTVKRNHLILDRLMQGDQEEQKLASATFEAIKRYNEAQAESTEQPSGRWRDRLSSFLYRQSGLVVDEELAATPIDLPQNISTLRFDASETAESLSAVPFMTQEADVIRMKANILLRQHGIKLSTAEAVASVKAAPIQATVDSKDQTSTVCLTLDVLPGTSIKIKGSFNRNTEVLSPIVDSFDLTIKSSHRGFPYPSQYTGWALSDALLPVYPLRMDQLPLFEALYLAKRQVALDLMPPDGCLLERAKEALRLREKAFLANSQEMKGLHQLLIQAILEAAPKGIVSRGAKKIVSTFFSNYKVEEFWTFFTQEVGKWNEKFLTRPQARLQDAWVANPESLTHNMAYASQLLSETKEMTEGLEGIMGKVLAHGAQPIILQSWSETLRITPEPLTDFQKRLQAAAYMQLKEFLEEMTVDHLPKDVEAMYTRMHGQLLSQIALFQASSFEEVGGFPVAIVTELEAYFNRTN